MTCPMGIRPRIPTAELRAAIADEYRRREAGGLPRPSLDELRAQVQARGWGIDLRRLSEHRKAMIRDAEIPDLRGRLPGPHGTPDAAAVAAALDRHLAAREAACRGGTRGGEDEDDEIRRLRHRRLRDDHLARERAIGLGRAAWA